MFKQLIIALKDDDVYYESWNRLVDKLDDMMNFIHEVSISDE